MDAVRVASVPDRLVITVFTAPTSPLGLLSTLILGDVLLRARGEQRDGWMDEEKKKANQSNIKRKLNFSTSL